MTGSNSAPLLTPVAAQSPPAVRVGITSSAGSTCSSSVFTSLDSNPAPYGPRAPCSMALVAGSGLSMAGTPSASPSNTPCPSECACYSPLPASSDVCAPGPFLFSCPSTVLTALAANFSMSITTTPCGILPSTFYRPSPPPTPSSSQSSPRSPSSFPRPCPRALRRSPRPQHYTPDRPPAICRRVSH